VRSRFISDLQDDPLSNFSLYGEDTNFFPASYYLAAGHSGAGSLASPSPVNLPTPTPTIPDESIQAQATQNGSGGAGSVVAVTSGSGGFTINLIFDAAAMAAPASFRAGIQQAASILSATITNKITVNINIDYSGTGGGAAAGPDNGLFESYSTVRTDLINNAAPGDTTFSALPTGSKIQGQSQVAVWNAQLKLFGLLSPNDTTTDDGSATFATDISPSLLVGVALHELTHALGRVPYGSQPDIFDLFRFTSAGTQLFANGNTAPAAYFSVDGGNTKLADFGQNSDPSDFLNRGVQGANDPFDEFYGGGTLQSLTTVDKEQLDALGFRVAPPPTPPTASVSSVANATSGQHIALSSLVSIVDPSNVGYQLLELWDSKGTVAGGQFVVNGSAQTGGHEIDVAPGNVAGTVFDAGTNGGTDTLWARLLESDGTLTVWQKFTVSVPTPTLTVSNDPSATRGQAVGLSGMVTISDAGHVGYQKLELWDSNGTGARGQFVVNGVAQTGGHEIDVATANVAGTVFDVGTTGGTDTLWAQLLENDGTLTGWQQFSVTAPVARTPTIAVVSDAAATSGQHIALSSLVTIADPDSVGYQKLELWDSNGTVAGGEFVVNGMAQTGGHEIDMAPGSVASAVFDAGTIAGTDTLWARLLQNDGTLTAWQPFTVSVPTPTLTVSNDASATSGQHIALSSLVAISDPGQVGYQKLELWDSNGTVAGGEFVVNGMAQTGGHEIDLAPGSVASAVFDAGTAGGTDSLWARLLQNDGTLTAWQKFSVTIPAAAQPMASTLAVQQTNDSFKFDAFDHGMPAATGSTLTHGQLQSMPALDLASFSFSDGHADHFPIVPATSLDVPSSYASDGEHLQALVHLGSFIIH